MLHPGTQRIGAYGCEAEHQAIGPRWFPVEVPRKRHHFDSPRGRLVKHSLVMGALEIGNRMKAGPNLSQP